MESKHNLTCTKHGDYFLPDLTLPESNDDRDIGIYGRRHLAYLKQHRRITYINLLTSGKLHSYLADVNEQATDMLLTIMEQMKKAQGVTEKLKSADQMAWVGKMNNIHACADEIVRNDLIYQ